MTEDRKQRGAGEAFLLVPLDGSDLSEKALPYVRALAKAMGVGVLLVTVWEEGERALIASMPDKAQDLFRRGEEHHERYLAGIAQKLQAAGIATETEVIVGEPAEEILHLVSRREPRLLALSTHGRAGLSRWFSGSVASRLVREAPVPTFVVGPRVLEEGRPDPSIRRILVPLDGSPLSESALRPAGELAEACGAELVLAEVLRWRSQAITFGVADVDIERIVRELEAAAQVYLAKAQDQLGMQRPAATRVLHGPPADALIRIVEDERIDLVVMASHTRAGLARAVLGSVADRMAQGKAPVLYVRPERVAGVTYMRHGRYCHNCGRASPFIEVLPEDRCLRCGEHLHACGNCVYYDGIECLLKRPEVHATYPGRDCPHFQFRENEGPRTESTPPASAVRNT